jgi:hypothetical protein
MYSQSFCYSNESLFDYEFIEDCLNMNRKRPMSMSQNFNQQNHQTAPKKMREWELNSFSPNQSLLNSKCEKRNERERNRVRLINQEFENLADLIFKSNFRPSVRSDEKENVAPKKRQYSKLNILKISMSYIQYLQELLAESEVPSENLKAEDDQDSMDYLQISFLTSDLDSAISSSSSLEQSSSSSQLEHHYDFDDSFLFV